MSIAIQIVLIDDGGNFLHGRIHAKNSHSFV